MQKQLLPATLHRLICHVTCKVVEKAARILQNIEGIAHIELDEEDVVRHRLVKAIIKAYDKDGEEQLANGAQDAGYPARNQRDRYSNNR